MNLNTSAIKSVTYYRASPVQTCDRCGQGIANVFAVSYRDDSHAVYGMDCIDRILAGSPTLKTLFHKNSKLLQRYKDYVAILSGPADKMPRGSEYYGSGLYFIADSTGKDILFEHWFFSPVFDVEKNAGGEHYRVKSVVEHVSKCEKDIEKVLPKLTNEILRLEGFLAKILRKATWRRMLEEDTTGAVQS